MLNAIKGAGIAAAQVRTAGFNVYPEYAQDRDKQSRVTGYRATNTVMVEVREITQVGKVLDTALAAGANTLNSAGFFSSRLEEARRSALSRAVEVARLVRRGHGAGGRWLVGYTDRARERGIQHSVSTGDGRRQDGDGAGGPHAK